jgi:hypothetical protein
MSSTFEFFIQVIEHDVSQKRRKWTALGNALVGALQAAIDHHPGTQEFADQLQHRFVMDLEAHPMHKQVLVDRIEIFFKIHVYGVPEAFFDVLLHFSDRVVGRPAWPEPVAVI